MDQLFAESRRVLFDVVIVDVFLALSRQNEGNYTGYCFDTDRYAVILYMRQ